MSGRIGRPVRRWRRRLRAVAQSPWFVRGILALIVVNAVVLGLETLPAVRAATGDVLVAIDRAILAVFVAELAVRFAGFGMRFLRDPWSLFDTAVVAVSLVPDNEAFGVLRALRCLRALRLISAFPQLRRVVQGLLAAIPGLGSIAAIMAVMLYVFAVMAANLFGAQYPGWFGGLHVALFTLFQIMTLEGWADIVRTVKQTHDYAWAFFLTFICLSSFTVLNLFIAVIVDTMQRRQAKEPDRREDALRRDLQTLGDKIERLARALPEAPAGQNRPA